MKRFLCAVTVVLGLGRAGPGVSDAFGFAEEPIGFRDPASGAVWDDPASTLHSDRTYVMALAAGFPQEAAAKLAIWEQLADSGRLGPGVATVYTNCLGSAASPPDRDAVCPGGYGDGIAVWPENFDPACATSRSGPYGPFFHFARPDSPELDALREWGWGRRAALEGYAAYAWGSPGDTVLTAPCRDTRPEPIQTGIPAGSTEAFATYLHALVDSFSHQECVSALDALGQPNLWGTHALAGAVVECAHDPASPANGDAHGQEYGSGPNTARTLNALVTAFDELRQRSKRREGRYFPMECENVLTEMEGQPTLEEAMIAFVTSWEFLSPAGDPGDAAASRRAHLDKIAAAILAQRKRAPRPSVTAISPTSVSAAGLGRDVRIVVTGRGFRRSSAAQLGWTEVPTSFRSRTQLVLRIPAALLAKEGRAGVTVYDINGGGGTRPRVFTYRYPAPGLGSLQPADVRAGSGALTLTLRGSKFVPASVVRWTRAGSTTELPTTYVSPAELTATVDPALVATPGRVAVRAATAGATTRVSGALTFTVKP